MQGRSISMKAFIQVSLLAIFVRTILLIYGEWQDRFLEVKYTDVDYWVFSDAASAILNGKSPYTRSTYRYTPLLALLLIPNRWYDGWGKVLFSACDVIAGYYIYQFLLRTTNASRAAKMMALFWLLNPMIFTISTRGNAESVMSCLTLAFLYYLTSKRYVLGGVFFGIAVHFKIFPILYSIAILTYLWSGKSIKSVDPSPMTPKMLANVTPSPSPASSLEGSPRSTTTPKVKQRKNRPHIHQTSFLATPTKINTVKLTSPKERFFNVLKFSVGAAFSFLLLTGLSYWFYEKDFLNEAIFYHLSRKDHRHNFSPYFYLFYTDTVLKLPRFAELFSFVPQFLVFIFAGIKFGRRDLTFACFIITFIFVAFNKVITSQYFVWYLTLFPMAYVSMHNISRLRWAVISGLWFGAQALWLNLAYRLEFLGMNTFLYLWVASLIFLVVNTWIAGQFIRHRLVPEILHAGPGIITLNNAVSSIE